MSTQAKKSPPGDFDLLIAEISNQYESLSKRLRDIARFALDNPSVMALETIANIARTANVQPSAVIRFAKALGYSGFSEMQRIYQSHVAKQSASYKERIRTEMSQGDHSGPNTPQSLLHQYCDANIVSLRNLQAGIDPAILEKAIKLIQEASHIYIMAQRRSFPVANFLMYMLSHVDCRTHLLDGQGGLLNEQAQAMTADDLLITISFYPYSEDTIKILTTAAAKGMTRIGMSDSDLSPVCIGSDAHFSIHDAEVHQFKSLSATMVVAQVLATSLAFNLEKNGA